MAATGRPEGVEPRALAVLAVDEAGQAVPEGGVALAAVLAVRVADSRVGDVEAAVAVAVEQRGGAAQAVVADREPATPVLETGDRWDARTAFAAGSTCSSATPLLTPGLIR